MALHLSPPPPPLRLVLPAGPGCGRGLGLGLRLGPGIPAQFPRARRSDRGPAAAAPRDGVYAFTEKSGYLFELSTTEADSLTDDDVAKIASVFRRRPLVLLRRLLQTATSFGRWFASRYLDGLMERSDQMFEAYIKVAQAISSRPGGCRS